MVLFSYPSISNKYFSLTIHPKPYKTYLKMQVFSQTVNTSAIPETYEILTQLLPSIHTSKCFNDKGLPFSKEVKRTEIGHLFEHILLEYLYQLKVEQNNYRIIIKGETAWNWIKDPYGVFHITINIGLTDLNILPHALNKAILLLEKILVYDPYHIQNKSIFSYKSTSRYYQQMAFAPSVEVV